MKNVENIIREKSLINQGDIVGVACSGGRDSMALLHYLNSIKEDLAFDVIAINIDHNIRPNSKEDSAFVLEYCKKNNIKCLSYLVDVPTYCLEKKLTTEEGARECRYDIFRSLINQGKVTKIALGHHMQDQSETVLLNILRGSGLSGASGMDYGTGQKFIRPMLATSRAEIQAYVENNSIPYVEDETNNNNEYSRNYIRNVIMPLIRSKWSAADQSICKFAEICRQDDKSLNDIANKYACDVRDGVLKISVSNFLLENSIVYRIIMRGLKSINASKDIESKHLLMIKDLALSGDNGSKINLPNSFVAIKEYNYVTITNRKLKTDKRTYPLKRGRLDLQEYGILDFSLTRKFEIGSHNHIFDYNKVPKDAVIRYREAGDVFQKFGGGTKSLSNYLIDKKVPTRLRNVLPVLAVGNEVLVVFGIEISNKVAVDASTKTAWAVDIYRY